MFKDSSGSTDGEIKDGHENRPYFCNCCGANLRKFEPLNPDMIARAQENGFDHPIDQWEMLNHENYVCISCGASDRERFIADYLWHHRSAVAEKTVLDIAPSPTLSSFIIKLGPKNYITADKYRDDVSLKIDLTDMSDIFDQSIDVFVCSHILEHIPDDLKAMSELRRILTDNGFGIVIVPISRFLDKTIEDPRVTDEAERLRLFGQEDHVRVYTKQTLIERLLSQNLFVDQVIAGELLPKRTKFRLALQDSATLYVVRRSRPKFYKLKKVVANLRRWF